MSSGSSGSTLINMPDYGDGLAAALTAQTRALSGELTGTSLQETMERYERPLRMSAAQIDNDVLRQTLLGGQVPVYESAKGKDIVQRRVFQPGEGGQTTQIDYGGQIVQSGPDAGKVITADAEPPKWVQKFREINALTKSRSTLAEASDAMVSVLSDQELLDSIPDEVLEGLNGRYSNATTNNEENYKKRSLYAKYGNKYLSLYQTIVAGIGDINRYKETDVFQTTLDDFGQIEPIYKKNEDGTDFIVPKDEDGDFILEATNETEIPEGGVAATPGQLTGYTRAGTGLVDMLGDSRNALGTTQVEKAPREYIKDVYRKVVGREPDEAGLNYWSQRIDNPSEMQLLEKGLLQERAEKLKAGQDVPAYTEGSYTDLRYTQGFGDTGRQAGFDAEGNFLGLAALAEDIQRGNLSRQREADLADVERLSGRYSDVMDQFRPGTQQALTDASAVLQAQKDNLTGAGAITVPGSSTYGGDITAGSMQAAQVGAAPNLTAGTSYNAAQVADPMALTAPTSYDPSASVTGDGYTATANLEGGNVGADSLRAALLADAETALSQGLTEREQASISNAARARSGMMGRTFDQSGAIAEAQALVAEDNNRRMQNRAFAGDTLGRESDIQRSDLERGLQANIRNQDALNRAAEFGASQNMQAQLANQAATNQALSQGLTAGLSQEALAAQQQQAKAMADATAANRASEFGVSSGMQQDALRAQLGQQTNMAQAQFDQQANAFGADAQQRANQVNQAQQQQANQFGVGATMDAQRLNEQLKQAGTLGYIDASTRLAALEDQYSLDPFQALLGRAGGGSLQAGQGVFGQAGYGLSSGPNYLNPESGLGFISQMAANNANMYAANQAANASRNAGMMGGLGSIFGGVTQGLIGLAG